MLLKSNVILLFIIFLIIFIIHNLLFSSNTINTIKILNLKSNFNSDSNYLKDKELFKKGDTLFSSFFDESKNLLYIIKYNSFIRTKKYHNVNQFDIISSKLLNVGKLINELNIYCANLNNLSDTIKFEIYSHKKNKKNYLTYFFQFFIISIFLFLLRKINNDRKL